MQMGLHPGSSDLPLSSRQHNIQAWRLGLQRLARNCHTLHSQLGKAMTAHGRMVAMSAGTFAMSAVPPPSGPQQPQKPKTINDLGHEGRRATDTLLVLNVLMFIAQWLSKDMLTFWGAKVNALIIAGQWWRLITPAVLHSNAFHLLINCQALHSIGPHLELVSGSARLGVVYAAAAFTGTLASYMFTPAPSLGASGALFGCGAALAVFYYRHKDVLQHHSDNMLKNLGVTLAINMGYSLLARNVDNWGHLGGAVGGAVVAWLIGPYLVKGDNGRFVDSPPLPWLAYSGNRPSQGRQPETGLTGKPLPRRLKAVRAKHGDQLIDGTIAVEDDTKKVRHTRRRWWQFWRRRRVQDTQAEL